MPDAAAANLRRQLQVDDPSSPANSLWGLVKLWSDWRAQQGSDPENPPAGFSAPTGGLSGLAAILRDAAGKPMRMYHGTQRSFKDFDPAKVDPQALYGPGHYFTDNPKVATEYSLAGSMEAQDALSGLHAYEGMKPFRPNDATVDGLIQHALKKLRGVIETEPGVSGANVRPAFLDINRPMEMDAAKSQPVIDALNSALARRGEPLLDPARPSFLGPDKPIRNDAVWNTLAQRYGAPEANRILAEAGFDGITHTGGKITGNAPHQVGIAFDPKQILSPWITPE